MNRDLKISGIAPVQPNQPRSPGQTSRTVESEFSELVRKEVVKGSSLRFSAHAQQRMASRRIELSGADQSTLAAAVDKAAAKGAKDSLILLRDLAFVVSVKNRTVVTALDDESMRENVFTGIDSAIVVK